MKSQRNPVFVLEKLLAPGSTHTLCSTKCREQEEEGTGAGGTQMGRDNSLVKPLMTGKGMGACENTGAF